jgi:hypothetical protein
VSSVLFKILQRDFISELLAMSVDYSKLLMYCAIYCGKLNRLPFLRQIVTKTISKYQYASK